MLPDVELSVTPPVRLYQETENFLNFLRTAMQKHSVTVSIEARVPLERVAVSRSIDDVIAKRLSTICIWQGIQIQNILRYSINLPRAEHIVLPIAWQLVCRTTTGIRLI
jgi:hypothetical protein